MTTEKVTKDVTDNLLSVCKAIAHFPEDVRLIPNTRENEILIVAITSKHDVGVFIGKKGQMIAALRTIANSIGVRNGVRVNFDLME